MSEVLGGLPYEFMNEQFWLGFYFKNENELLYTKLFLETHKE